MDKHAGEASQSDISYEPISVKELLVKMRDTAELMIDLGYSSLLYRSEDLAEEVLHLEEHMDILALRARMSLLMAARNPQDAEELAPVLGIVAAADQISDAAGDIAKIVLDETRFPTAMRAAIPDAAEVLVRGTVADSSEYAGRTLEDIDLESETGVRALAIRRENEWIHNPGPTTTLRVDDVVFLRGPDQAITNVYTAVTDQTYSQPTPKARPMFDLSEAVEMILRMKDLSELAVDLAYGSVLFDDVELAREVRNIEIEVDELEGNLETWLLQAATRTDEPKALRGLIALSGATEGISDAAIQISEGVLRRMEVHPVVRLAVQESDEIIARIEVEDESALDGAVVTDGIPDVDTTMSVIAIRRPNRGWLLSAKEDITVRAGDILIAKGPNRATDRFRSFSDS